MLKHTMWRVYRRTRKEEDYAKYKEALNAATTEIRQSKRSHEQKLACDIKNDSKSFYAYVRSKQNVQDKVGPLEDSAGNIISQGILMAEYINSYFSSVFTKEDISSLPFADAKFQGAKSDYLGPLVVTPELVAKKIKAMKDNKSPGVDGIPPKLLMEKVDQISIPLERVFNLSLKEGVVPFEWKEANIIPLFKKGSRNKSENYRPVSLTSVMCKLLERLIKDHMVDFLVKHKLLNSSQHGFLKARSCLTNMLCFLEEITKWIDVGSPVAFDKVPHQRLLLKLKAHGIGDSITDWIEQWLTDRRQRVVVDGEVSNWKSVLSGVPQGSVLLLVLVLVLVVVLLLVLVLVSVSATLSPVTAAHRPWQHTGPGNTQALATQRPWHWSCILPPPGSAQALALELYAFPAWQHTGPGTGVVYFPTPGSTQALTLELYTFPAWQHTGPGTGVVNLPPPGGTQALALELYTSPAWQHTGPGTGVVYFPRLAAHRHWH